MKYYGGKTIHGKEISEILKKIIIENNIHKYIEPFCGALGIMKHMKIPNYACKYFACDASKDLILLWKSVQNKTFDNPKINKTKWNLLKNSDNASPEKSFAGYALSFSGIYFGSYVKNYNDIVYNNLYRYDLSHIKFEAKDYKKLTQKVNKGGYLIYCDPPYKNTDCSPYKRLDSSIEFNSDEFWNFANYWKSCGNIVVVSEFTAPKGWKCIWSKPRKNLANAYTELKQEYFVEKLFIF